MPLGPNFRFFTVSLKISACNMEAPGQKEEEKGTADRGASGDTCRSRSQGKVDISNVGQDDRKQGTYAASFSALLTLLSSMQMLP